MAFITNLHDKYGALGKRAQLVVLPVMALVAIGVITLAILTIIIMPSSYNITQRGVGANGFRAYEESGTTLGIDKTVSKSDVAAVLGDKAIKVNDPVVSRVINLDGNRGQTATYDFIRADGVAASVYVDVMMFKNTAAMDGASILTATLKAGTVKGYPAYFMHAQTIGEDREYRLLVVNGLKAYKFVMTQPFKDITINEVSAVASLKRLAQKANL